MQLGLVVDAWEAVRSTRSRLAKVATFSELLGAADAESIPLVVSYLAGDLPQGRIGLGYSAVGSIEVPPSEQTSLVLDDLDTAFSLIKSTSGTGSKKAKSDLLAEVLQRATATEQQFITSLLLGGLRQGALAALMTDAVADAAALEVALVRRAAMVTGDLALVATEALTNGAAGLEQYGLTVFTALQPMLAQSAESVEAALAKTGMAAVEWKVDGARVQVHRKGSEIRVFTRNLRDITGSLPGVEHAVAELDVDSIILDGEAVFFDQRGEPAAFQETMSRFSSDGAADQPDAATTHAADGAEGDDGALNVIFFDCLHLDGRDLIDLPGHQRWKAMTSVLPPQLVIPRITTDDPTQAQAFLNLAIDARHEGVMVKALDAGYAAGRRGADWVKVKPVHTLDLVVLAVEWGSGRRQGWLSNIHLGARDPNDATKFIMLGKTFKGMTDKTLAWQTERFLELEDHRDGHVVYVRPEQVVEIAVDGIQRSSRYPGGVALRFARVRGYRDDKTAAEADTIDDVRRLG